MKERLPHFAAAHAPGCRLSWRFRIRMTNDELLRQLAEARRQLTRWIVLTQPLSNKLEELRALEAQRDDLIARIAALTWREGAEIVAADYAPIAEATRALRELRVTADEIETAVRIGRELVAAVAALR